MQPKAMQPWGGTKATKKECLEELCRIEGVGVEVERVELRAGGYVGLPRPPAPLHR